MTDPREDFLIGSTDDLALLLGGSADSFTGDLLRLIAKADSDNRVKLIAVYPREVYAYATWMTLSPTPTAGQMRAALEPVFLLRGQDHINPLTSKKEPR